jgi:RNA polymerase sigma-70 factor (ECF subfamily)
MIQLAVENNRQHSNKSILGFHQNVKYLSFVCKDLQQAEDVMITSFMKAFSKLKSFNITEA